jgi:hypothetical protein
LRPLISQTWCRPPERSDGGAVIGNKKKTQDQTQVDQRHGDWNKDQSDWKKGTDEGPSQHDWSQGRDKDAMEQGKATRPPQPSGTTPLERDQRPINQSR